VTTNPLPSRGLRRNGGRPTSGERGSILPGASLPRTDPGVASMSDMSPMIGRRRTWAADPARGRLRPKVRLKRDANRADTLIQEEEPWLCSHHLA
jgi:hypothetical protein